jgi:hypothetical protein
MSCSCYFLTLRPLCWAPMLSGVVDSVTQPSTLRGSATISYSSTLGPPPAPYPNTYLDYVASFHMTHHSTHLSSLHPS